MQDLQQQSAMLQKEYEYEKELYRQQTREAGIPKRIQQGVCWFPVKLGADRYNSLNQLTVEVTRTETEETEHSFEYGCPVCFFRISADRQIRYFNFSAVISYVQDNKMVVVLPGPQVLPELVVTGELGVQLYFDDTSYKTMFAALREVAEAKGNRTARLREVLLGKAPALRRETGPVRFPWLNASQEKAVNQVLCAKEVAVVHGPPGTGKTTTLVEAVYETLHRENQVMVSAQSNTAVDWIAEKLVDRGIPVLRIGNPTRVNDKMLAFTYERRFEAHSDYPELWQIRKTIREMTGRLRKSGREDRERLHNQLTKLRVRATGLEIRIDTELFTEARVIACTLVGAASRVLERKRFSSLFIDEAAQAIEAACWICDLPGRPGDSGRRSLPATADDQMYRGCPGGLGRTLLEKVVLHKPETVSLLKIQYRMHEDIMRFPSRWFYHDELEAAPEVKYRGILDFDTPASWIDTSELDLQEKAVAEGTGRLNTGEAELLVRELKNYMERIGIRRILEEHIDFGVISPYRAQVHYLRHLLKKEPFFRPCRRLITVHTVDGFQGQERDVIMISLVRANEKGQIGFLRDLRRMNVAITRARMKLLILGEAVTLTRHPFYRELYEYIGGLR